MSKEPTVVDMLLVAAVKPDLSLEEAVTALLKKKADPDNQPR